MGLDSPSLGAIRVNSRGRRGSKRFRPQGMQSSIALETIARFRGSRIRGCRGPEADNQQQADAGLKKRQRQRKKSHGDAGQRRVGKLPHHPLHEGAERRQPHGSVDEDVDPERQAQERIRQAPIQRSIVLRLGHLLGHLRGPLSRPAISARATIRVGLTRTRQRRALIEYRPPWQLSVYLHLIAISWRGQGV